MSRLLARVIGSSNLTLAGAAIYEYVERYWIYDEERRVMPPLSGFEHFVRAREPLAQHTWFRLGGAAEYFAEPTSVE